MSVRGRTLPRPSGAVHGVLLVDKPPGLTSHDVVGQVRRAFGTRRVGHAGTLDPMATGVLVVLLGEATKLSSVLTTDRKRYEAQVTFGTSTDTLDKEGKITKRRDLSPGWLDEDALLVGLDEERQRRVQVPPQVSALKVDGQRAYARARKGLTTELAPRDVCVHDLTLLEREEFSLRVSVDVSKGYYVRCLARDLGEHLRVPAHLSELRRTRSGPFSVEQTVPLPVTGDEPLLPLSDVTKLALPWLEVTGAGAVCVRQGKELVEAEVLASGSNPENDETLFAAFWNGTLLALVKPSGPGRFRVQRGINDPTLTDFPLPPAELDG